MSLDKLQRFVDGICDQCELGDKPVAPPHSSIVGSSPVHANGMVCTAAIPREQREVLAGRKGWQRESEG